MRLQDLVKTVWWYVNAPWYIPWVVWW